MITINHNSQRNKKKTRRNREEAVTYFGEDAILREKLSNLWRKYDVPARFNKDHQALNAIRN